MRQIIVLCLLSAALSLPLAAAHGQTEADYVVRPTAAPCLRLRDAPNTNATQTDCLVPGTRVTAFESVPYWRRVRLADSRTGWVSKQFLELVPPGQPPTTIPANAWLEVHFVDVGQGDAIWIHTHDDLVDGNGMFEGRNIVIDGGPNAWLPANQLVAYLLARAHPGAIVDALIVTHPHIDHYAGARGVLQSFQVRDYYDPGQTSTNSTYRALLDSVGRERVNGEPARMHLGQAQFGTPNWGSEVRAEFLWSWPGTATGLGADGTLVNNASIVLRIEYGAHSFLFVGDLEGKERDHPETTLALGEARVLQDVIPNTRLRSTVVKVGHHGSETSSTLPFLQAVNPEIAVITSGRKHFSGRFLPDPGVIARLCALGTIRLVRTDQNDAAQGLTETTDADADHVVIRTNGTTIEVRAFSNGTEINPLSTC